MDAHSLMRQLMEIERALPAHDDCAIRNLILVAQDGVLQLERENEELALENASLRLRLGQAHGASVPLFARSLNAEAQNSAEAPHFFANARLDRSTDDDSDGQGDARTWRTTHFFFS